MPEKRLAYVSPDGERNGEMTFLPEGETHSYRTGQYGPSGLSPGLYDISYNVTQGERGLRTYDIYYLNEAEATTPADTRVLFALVREMTGFADRIIPRFSEEEEIEDVLPRLTSQSWLEEIKGIGPSRSESLVEKFETFSPGEIEVYSAYRQHGIPYRRENRREEWAKAFFNEYEEELEAFRENPYHLLQITDESRSRVRNLARMNPDVKRSGYSLRWVDEKVMDHDSDTWEKSPERCRAYLREAARRVFRDGHTVATYAQLAEEMRWMGFKSFDVKKDGETTRVSINATVVKKLVYNTPQLEIISFNDTRDGRTGEGVTTPQLKMHAQIIRKQMLWLGANDVPFSELSSKRMVRRALDTVPFELDEAQESAVRYAFSNCISAITGPAGAGKTTVLRCILNGAAQLLSKRVSDMPVGTDKQAVQTGMSIYVTAPTGKATQRIREGLEVHNPHTGDLIEPQPIDRDEMPDDTDHLEEGVLRVGTLHSFLGYRGSHWIVPRPHPSFIVVDESSMMDQEAMYYLCRYLQNCLEREIPVMLLMTGDVEQLEPVGAGYPFRDVLGTTAGSIIPSTQLNKIHRQGQSSTIIEASQAVLRGEHTPTAEETVESSDLKNDFYWHDYPPLPEEEKLDLWRYLQSVADRANRYTSGPHVDPEDIQVILPLRNPSSIDAAAPYVRQVNEELQDIFAEQRGVPIEGFDAASINDPDKTYGKWFAVGDRVVHTGRNGYTTGAEDAPQHEPIMRGAVGTITTADPELGLRVEYPTTERPVAYVSPEEVGQLGLAYALTGHTAQGSEFDVVAIALPKEAAPTLMTRSWLYTAITRASRFLDLMATQSRVQLCARTDSGGARQTILSREVAKA